MRHIYSVIGLILLAVIAAGQTRANAGNGEEAFYRSQITPMALNIYNEGRGEKELGQMMVAYVTLMRARDNRQEWGGSSILGVVFKGHQFSWTSSKAKAKLPQGPAWDKAVAVATWVALGFFEAPDVLIEARYYMNPDTSNPSNRCWMATHMVQVGVVGNHYFYREPKPGEKVKYVPPRFNCT
ncbi:MAG TPA: cell wall hydrolase [Candidatus Paceibacterota bacterium]|nr:cell wall hydrolase [Candidatus Paceibacterota bacterium]